MTHAHSLQHLVAGSQLQACTFTVPVTIPVSITLSLTLHTPTLHIPRITYLIMRCIMFIPNQIVLQGLHSCVIPALAFLRWSNIMKCINLNRLCLNSLTVGYWYGVIESGIYQFSRGWLVIPKSLLSLVEDLIYKPKWLGWSTTCSDLATWVAAHCYLEPGCPPHPGWHLGIMLTSVIHPHLTTMVSPTWLWDLQEQQNEYNDKIWLRTATWRAPAHLTLGGILLSCLLTSTPAIHLHLTTLASPSQYNLAVRFAAQNECAGDGKIWEN